LFFGAKLSDLADGERVVGRNIHRERRKMFRHLLDGKRRDHVAQTAAAVFLRRDHAHQSDPASFGKNFARQFFVVIPLVGMGRHFVLAKFRDVVEKRALLIVERVFQNHKRKEWAAA
jgi:hypothetical protein